MMHLYSWSAGTHTGAKDLVIQAKVDIDIEILDNGLEEVERPAFWKTFSSMEINRSERTSNCKLPRLNAEIHHLQTDVAT